MYLISGQYPNYCGLYCRDYKFLKGGVITERTGISTENHALNIIAHKSIGRNFMRVNNIRDSCRHQSASWTLTCLLNYLKYGTQTAALSTLIVSSQVDSVHPVFHLFSPSRLQLVSQVQVGKLVATTVHISL